MLTMAPPNTCCTIKTKIEANAFFVTSLSECSRCYIYNKKTIIIVDNIREVEIGLKATISGRRRTFVVAKFDLGGGDMKVKLHTPEPLCTDTDGYGG